MRPTNLVAGIGGIGFGVLTFAGVFLISPPGGSYSESAQTTFVNSAHRGPAFVGLYLVMVATLGLILLLARIRESGTADAPNPRLEVFWAASLAGAVSFAIGWSIILSVPIAYSFGGSGYSITPQEIFTVVQAGNAVSLGASGILLGLGLIALFLTGRRTMPVWLGWITLVAGVLGLASPLLFPVFAILAWSVIAGIWLLARRTT